MYAELNERAEAVACSYFATDDFLQYIYSAIVAKNHQKIRSRCFFDKIHFTDIFNDIYHDYRVAILTKISLWLLPFYMAMAIYCYYVKVRRAMRTATVLYWCHSMAHIGSPEPASMLCVCFVFLYLSFFSCFLWSLLLAELER